MNDPEVRSMPAKPHPLIQFLMVMTLCYAVSFGSSEMSLKGLTDYYSGLTLPKWAIASWYYSPIWTIHYGLMGLACWVALREPNREGSKTTRAASVSLFVVQLFLGGAWAWLFFVAQRPPIAALDGGLTTVVLALAAWATSRYQRSAALLLLGPVLWSFYLAALSTSVWRLNR